MVPLVMAKNENISFFRSLQTKGFYNFDQSRFNFCRFGFIPSSATAATITRKRGNQPGFSFKFHNAIYAAFPPFANKYQLAVFNNVWGFKFINFQNNRIIMYSITSAWAVKGISQSMVKL